MFQSKVAERVKTHILCSRTFPANRAVCEIMCRNMVEPDLPQMAVQYGACVLHVG